MSFTYQAKIDDKTGSVLSCKSQQSTICNIRHFRRWVPVKNCRGVRRSSTSLYYTNQIKPIVADHFDQHHIMAMLHISTYAGVSSNSADLLGLFPLDDSRHKQAKQSSWTFDCARPRDKLFACSCDARNHQEKV